MNDLKDFIIVFDLDDTLYPERDYVISGIKYLEIFLNDLYKKDSDGLLLVKYNAGFRDFMKEAFNIFNLNKDMMETLIWLYRLHVPKIKLDADMKHVLDKLTSIKATIVILTDGRSVTQRLKINSLGLSHLPVYISEEYSSEKPDKKRFLQIEKDFPKKRYVYIADNPSKDFIAPLKRDWICIGANWIKNRIHSNNLKEMPDICLESPYRILDILMKLK